MHFKIYTVIYFFNLHSIVRYWCSPAYLLFEVTLNFLLCGCCRKLPPEFSNDGTHSPYNELSTLIKGVEISDLSQPFGVP